MLQLILNRYLQLSTNANHYLNKLEGKTLHIICTDLPQHTYICTFEHARINLHSSPRAACDVTMQGQLQDYVHYAIFKKARHLQITGDAHTAALIQKLYLNLNIDWEEELSKITGDTIAHQALFWFKQVRDYSKHSVMSLAQMVTEYLQEETYTLPTADEIEAFMHEVDELRLRVDRLEERLKAYASN